MAHTATDELPGGNIIPDFGCDHVEEDNSNTRDLKHTMLRCANISTVKCKQQEGTRCANAIGQLCVGQSVHTRALTRALTECEPAVRRSICCAPRNHGHLL